MIEKRPELTKNISAEDFADFYWLKAELLHFCRTEKLNIGGGKLELAKRIEKYLETGIREKNTAAPKRTISKYDWNNEKLTLETIITDNYKNTENVRLFFVEQIGSKFKFNVMFMNWMKGASGKTLKQAVVKWSEIAEIMKIDKSPKEIPPQFEYNTYIRDFLKDNSGKSKNEAVRCWKIKRTLRGNNKYEKSDLEFIDKKVTHNP